MEFHPDRNDGCQKKAQDFKDLTEAYTTLNNTGTRNAYDQSLLQNHHPHYQYGFVNYTKQTVDQRTAHYRKVYAPRPPPGFKVFDYAEHERMHYGDGIMEEEIERMRKRAQKAGSFNEEYESPLGKGFTVNMGSSSKSKKNNGQWVRSGKKKRFDGLEFETAYFDDSLHSQAARSMRAKETILERMKARREERHKRTTNGNGTGNGSEKFGPGSPFQTIATPQDDGCTLM